MMNSEIIVMCLLKPTMCSLMTSLVMSRKFLHMLSTWLRVTIVWPCRASLNFRWYLHESSKVGVQFPSFFFTQMTPHIHRGIKENLEVPHGRAQTGPCNRVIPTMALRSTYIAKSHCSIDWKEARMIKSVQGYWERRTMEAIEIKKSRSSMNLDRGIHPPSVWNWCLT